MKWVIMFLICGQEVCTTYIPGTRYMSKEHCEMMINQVNPNKIFGLKETDKEVVKFCTPEAELSHLTDRVVEEL